MSSQEENKKSFEINDNKYLSNSLRIIFTIFLGFLFYRDIELLFGFIIVIICGSLGTFFIRRYGFWGKLITLFISMPIFFIPKSVWKLIDELEEKEIKDNKAASPARKNLAGLS
jgi:hypothetical protein